RLPRPRESTARRSTGSSTSTRFAADVAGQRCPTEARTPHAVASPSRVNARISLTFIAGIRVAPCDSRRSAAHDDRKADTVKLDQILVPLDGSMLAEAALPAASDFAARDGAIISLLRAAEGMPRPGGDAVEAQVTAIREAEAYLASVVRRLADKGVT